MSAPSFMAKRFALLDLANADAALMPAGFKCLYALLSLANNQTGRCYPAKGTVAARAGLSIGGAKKALRHLRETGYVVVLVETSGRGHANEIGFGFEKLTGTTAERGPARDPFTTEKRVPERSKGVPSTHEKGPAQDPHLTLHLAQEGTLPASPSVACDLEVEPDALERAGSSAISEDLDEAPFGSAHEESSDTGLAEREAEIEREEAILAALRGGRDRLADGTRVQPPEPNGRASSLVSDDYRRAHWVGKFVTACNRLAGEERRAFRSRELDAVRTRLHREGRNGDEVNRAMSALDDEAAQEFRNRIPPAHEERRHDRS